MKTKTRITTQRFDQVISAIETGRGLGRRGKHCWAEVVLESWERGTEITELRNGGIVVRGIWIGISGKEGHKWVVWDHCDTVKETRRKVRSYSKQCDENTPWTPTFKHHNLGD